MKSMQISKVLPAVIILSTFCTLAFAGDIYHPITDWSFDETSGAIAHDSASGINGTLMNGATRTAGKFGNAVSLDGIDDYVKISNANDTAIEFNKNGRFTISVWAKPQNSGYLITKLGSQSGSFGYWIGYDATNKFYRFNVDASRLGDINVDTDRNVIPLNTWSNIVAVYDSTYMRIYRDGILKNTSRFCYDSGGTFPDNDMTIGAWVGLSYFNGLIDDVRIYDYALNSGEVAELYTIPEPATICLFGFAGLFLQRKNK